ncbi:lipocalin family protein [Spongisporangium articulatum]|uniref:Lipocalin family protein n=1 Tax=Spongisporangium articulatum TaxID=3362603 RepID=A0ABW8ANG3_9ACTN
MIIRWKLAALTAVAGLALTAAPASAAGSGIVPVAQVDVNRYLGTWKQIADIPQWYEALCVRDVTANYSLNADGTVKVVNTCTGPLNSTIKTVGGARVLDPGTNAKLQVSFVKVLGKQVYTGSTPNYVIIGLADDYSWAVVGDPSRSSAYILSRTPTLTGDKLEAARDALRRSGYDPDKLKPTKQTV